MTTHLSEQEMELLRAAHTEGKHASANRCACCLAPWPCPTVRLLDALRAEREAARMLRSQLEDERDSAEYNCHYEEVEDVGSFTLLRRRLTAAETQGKADRRLLERCRAVRPRLCDKGHPREEQWAHCDCLGRDLDARLGGPPHRMDAPGRCGRCGAALPEIPGDHQTIAAGDDGRRWDVRGPCLLDGKPHRLDSEETGRRIEADEAGRKP